MDEIKPGNGCPLLGLDAEGKMRPCQKFECKLYIQVRGFEHNSGREVDHWGCSWAWLPHLIIDSANQTREVSAGVQSLRNRVAEANAMKRAEIAASAPADATSLFLPQHKDG